ncbi:MAG TPA: dicarboxylate/amino acid:cation symporter [Fimbriimonadaceae bacterium]|nr:dicarboxylate/amino acid:cation symporter [Fimbriimonadaceae bacterium]HRE94475.1 dicarboxylate/amino acid:cation symporter [Fimbriimonadaceae bacterium]HRI74783.1 dicarboxylate/amino acid:cation symporter [Fimbriimonadaceae bacterium]
MSETAPAAKRKMPQHTKIFVGLLLGAMAGAIAQSVLPEGTANQALKDFNANWATPLGDIFLYLIFMVVVPLLFSALVNGVAEIGEAAKVGRTGLRALLLTIILSGIAVGIGLGGVNLVKPGAGISDAERERLTAGINAEEAKKKAEVKAEADEPPVWGIIPKNPLKEANRALTGGILPFMFFALVFGLALAAVEPERAAPVKNFIEGLFLVSQKMVEFAMKYAPIGVFFLVFRAASSLGANAVVAVGQYVILVLAALALHMFVTYPIFLKFVAKRDPVQFFRQCKEVILTAFSTSSSNATLPVALRVAEQEVGLPRKTSSFVLTVGATANQNGTALFEGITILFLAQFAGVNLDFSQQLTIMGLAILAGIGTAGVPGGAWPMIGVILAKFGIPVELIGVVIGIDRILDMSRTVLNVVGDITIAACVSGMEGGGVAIPEGVD